MTRRSLLASLAACTAGAGAVAGTALAHHSSAAAYAAKLVAVEDSGAAGAARLLDEPGKGRDVLTIAVRGLTPRAAYAFHVHETDEPGDPCLTPHDAEGAHGDGEHEAIAGWSRSRLRANARGRAVATARARGFEKHADETYWVDVETPAGGVVACGVLRPKR